MEFAPGGDSRGISKATEYNIGNVHGKCELWVAGDAAGSEGSGCGCWGGGSEMKNGRSGIHQIAELASVSIGTVDRALHGRNGIKESTRQRILQIARQIGYTPNFAARALSASKTGVRIGVCVPREIRFFYDQLWSGVLDEARRLAQLGVQLNIARCHARWGGRSVEGTRCESALTESFSPLETQRVWRP